MFFIKNKSEKSVAKGALWLAAGAFAAKIIGALYRIPLTNLLKSQGIGLYQMVFPVYALLLEFSGAGVPTALSAIISGYRGDNKEIYARRVLKNSVRIFAAVGFILTLALVFSGKTLSELQGDKNAVYGYILMSPAVFFTSLISCYRGYFQGLMNMSPTAISQIIEQTVKLALGLFFAYALLPDVPLAVGGATLAVSASEGVALSYLYFLFKKGRVSRPLTFDGKIFISDVKKILSMVIPITLIGIIMPLSHIADSFFIVNFLSRYSGDGTKLYGLLSGAANTVINLPVSLLYALAATAIPAIISAKTKADAERKEKNVLLFTLGFSVLFSVFCYVFSPLAVKILFGSLPKTDKRIAVNLIRASSGNIVFLSVLQTVNSIHVARKNPYKPIIGLIIGAAVKIALFPVLLSDPSLNIYGGAACLFACYFSATLINLLLLLKVKENYAFKKSYGRKRANA